MSTALYPCLVSHFVKFRASELMSYFIHFGCAVMVPADGIIEIPGIQTEVELTRFLPSICYSCDLVCWFVCCGEDTRFYYLVPFCHNFGTYGNWTFPGVCMTGWALSHSLIVYSQGNQPMPWNLSWNSLMRSTVDLIGVVFLGVGSAAGAGVGPGSWEVSWMTLTAQFILMTYNLSHDRSPKMAGPGVSATYQQEFISWGCAPG